MKKNLLLLTILFFAVSSFSQITVAVVSGQVLDSLGVPIPNYQVTLTSDSSQGASIPAGFNLYDYTNTDSSGNYTYTVNVSDSTMWFSAGSIMVSVNNCHSITTDTLVDFSSGNINLTANFSICRPCTNAVSFNYSFNHNYPNNLGINFTPIGNDSITSFSWNFGDYSTSTSMNPVHIYASAGFYFVSLTYTTNFGCTDSIVSQVVPGFELSTASYDWGCDADFTFVTSDSITFNFGDASVPGGTVPDHITKWAWDFGDGVTSTLQNPNHTYSAPGIYNVSLLIFTAQGCSSSLSVPIESQINTIGNCNTDFEILYNYGPPWVFLLQDASNLTYYNQITTSYFWDFGDGNTSVLQKPIHTYSSPGVYHITHTTTTATGCSSTYTENFVVGSECYVYVEATSIINESTPGMADGEIDINVVGIPPFTYSWNNNQTTQNATGLTQGYYNVLVWDANGCNTLATFDILANSDSANWNYVDTLLQTNPLDTCLNFISNNASIYSYSFGNNSDISITWILYDSTQTLHTYITTDYVFDTTSYGGYYSVLLNYSCDSVGRNIPMIHKFIDSIHIGNVPTDIKTIVKEQLNVTVYPNPVKDNLTISYILPDAELVSVEIINSLGQLMKTERVQTVAGKVNINTSDLIEGIYFVKLKYNCESTCQKFIKE